MEVFQGFVFQTAAICAVIGYLLGNFQTAIVVSRRILKDDVRDHGSGNPGATNMTRTFGTKWGLVTFAGDALKCVVAVLLGRWMAGAWGLFPSDAALSVSTGGYMAGAFVVLGHCYPVIFRFKGGKGSACTFAFMWINFPLAAAVVAVFAVIVYLFSKKISLVSLTAAALFCILCIAGSSVRPMLWPFALMCLVLVVIRHKDNIKRLIAGTESTVDY